MNPHVAGLFGFGRKLVHDGQGLRNQTIKRWVDMRQGEQLQA